MALSGVYIGIGQYYPTNSCPSDDGCPQGVCPDIILRRHDTSPPFRVQISDCDGALDLSDENLIVEVSMWAKAKLRRTITTSSTTIEFADGIGFNQVLVGDTLYFQNVRTPEAMLVTAINELTKEITVSRGEMPVAWKKGTAIVVYRILNAAGEIETVTGDFLDETGTTLTDQLIETNLLYQWDENDTILPGCFYFEFKLVKLIPPINNIFANFKMLLEYPPAGPPIFVTPEMMISDSDFVYPWCSFILNPVLADEYDYFSIFNSGDVITVNAPEDGTGVITVTSEFINDGISIIPVYDQGETISTISITDESGGQVQGVQPGLTIVTQGEIESEGLVVGSFTSGSGTTPLIVTFNVRATKAIVEAVLQNIIFINLSADPSEETRKFTYQMVDGDGLFSDLIPFYLGVDSMPPVADLEGIDWIRRFPTQEGFLVKINP